MAGRDLATGLEPGDPLVLGVDGRLVTRADLDTNASGILDDDDMFVSVGEVTLAGDTRTSTVIDVGVFVEASGGRPQAYESTLTLFGATDVVTEFVIQ